jgi:tRNA uridine 5-carboxymethylaminomethyl modification enzyme
VSYAWLMSLDGGRYASPDLPTLPLFHVKHGRGWCRGRAGRRWPRMCLWPVVEQVEIAAKYSGYIDRQNDEVERAAHYENLRLPDELDYMQVTALSIEARQRLSKQRPETLGQASRMSGITPATFRCC